MAQSSGWARTTAFAELPVNAGIEFTLDKDKMKFKANGKKYGYLIVSETATAAPQP
jgi:hypothetical protein